MDFFERINSNLPNLNINERKLLDYVVRNIQSMPKKSIRQVAQENFVSTTTVLRLTKKLGFDGYRDFSDAIKIALHNTNETNIPNIIWRKEYSEEYLKNIIESVRVLSYRTIEQFQRALESSRTIYFYGNGLDRNVARYAYRLFTSTGYTTYFPEDDYEVSSMLAHIEDGDILFLFSLTGEDKSALRIVEQARAKCKPLVASVTWSGNNTLQNLSDLDFYVFADKITYQGYDLTSRVSMIAIVEMIAYQMITNKM